MSDATRLQKAVARLWMLADANRETFNTFQCVACGLHLDNEDAFKIGLRTEFVKHVMFDHSVPMRMIMTTKHEVNYLS